MRVPEIKLLPLREAVSNQKPTTLDLLIKIISPEFDEKIERPPLNIGLVLDRSGSMHGQKIEYVRQAAIFAVKQLLPTDRVSVTIYNDKIETLVPSTLAVNKSSITQKIKSIYPRNNTALHAGWVNGGIQVSQYLDQKSLNRVILLSDGLANVGETNPDIIATDVHGLVERGVSTTTIGVGLDYNEDLMEAMARSGDGNYYFIESPDQLPNIFDIEMQGLIATIGRDVKIKFEPLSGVTVQELLNNLDAIGEDHYRMPNLEYSQEINVVIRLKVPALSKLSELCKVSLSWYDPKQESDRDSISILKLPSVTTAEMEKYDINPEVRQQVALQKAAQARDEAMDHVNHGNVEAAVQLLQDTRSQILNNPDLASMAPEAESLNDLAEQLKMRKFASYQKLSKFHSHNIAYGKLSHALGYLYGSGPEYGDLTSQNVDAIVNSAHYNFQSHGPLSQDILHAAGPQLQEELEQIGDCSYGEARITRGYNLPAKWVIHTVVPPWNGGQNGEEAILTQCYRNSLDLAIRHGVKSIAFPALGTGNLGYSPKQAAKVAFLTTNRYLYHIGEIKFVCNNRTILKAYEKVYSKVGIVSKVLKTLKK